MKLANRLLMVFSFLSSVLLLIATGCDSSAHQSLVPAQPAVSQVAKECVLALKKLEAKIEIGISYDDYINALGDSNFAANLFLDSRDSAKYPQLADAVRRVMSDYQFAGNIWKLRLKRMSVPRDFGIHGAVRLTDVEGQEIISKLPGVNKPISGRLLAKWLKNTLVIAGKHLGVGSPTDEVVPLAPNKDDGALFEREGYPRYEIVGENVYYPKGAKKEMIQYLDLEIVFRLLWLRAGENLAKAYNLIS